MRDLNIQKLQTERNMLRKKAHEKQTTTDWEKFRIIRNQIKKEIKSAKKNFYQKALSSKKPKEVWSTIHRLLNPSNVNFKVDPTELNHHYTNMATQLTGQVRKEHLSDTIQNLAEHDQIIPPLLKHTNTSEVRKLILNLRNDCSTGSDQIPVKFLKPVVDFIVSPITHIINNSIDKRIFPDLWKVARVCPVAKVKLPIELTDYRPISILPTLSKIMERTILCQVLVHIENHCLYNATQSGYRKGHSTITLLLKFRDDIQNAMNRGEVTLSVLADLSKAFDTVNHATLIKKLHQLQLPKDFLLIIASYLTDRRQFVQVNDKRSNQTIVTFGVPQGSILGPVLFNLYVQDMINNISSQSIQFADDTSIYRSCKAKKIQDSASNLTEDLNNLGRWCEESNLIFNADKTKTMLFSTPQMSRVHNLSSNDSYTVKHNNIALERVRTWKLLGIKLSENMEWVEHINNSIIITAYDTLRTLRKINRLTPFHVRKRLAESLILSRIDYGSVVYGECPEYLLKRLQRVQNAAAGFVLRQYCKESDVVNKLKWLPIKERFDYDLVKLTHKILYDRHSPSYLSAKTQNFEKTFRTNKDFTLERSYDKKTFSEQSAVKFNDLPLSIRKITDYKKFCSDAKSYYLDKAIARTFV